MGIANDNQQHSPAEKRVAGGVDIALTDRHRVRTTWAALRGWRSDLHTAHLCISRADHNAPCVSRSSKSDTQGALYPFDGIVEEDGFITAYASGAR